MSAKNTDPKSSADAGKGASLPAQQVDVAEVSTSAASDPSGVSVPDGTLSAHTPESERTEGDGDPAIPSGMRYRPDGAWLQIDDADAFRKAFPALSALRPAESHPSEAVLQVRSTIAGFRRGGIAHPLTVVAYPLFSLAPAQIEAILTEPVLVAAIV